MTDDDLRLAPAGASDAACAVCLHMTFNRIVEGDGHVPICSTFCLQAWPRVRDLLADRDEWRTQHENLLACAAADQRALLRVSRAAKAFRDWDAIGALLSGDEPHAEDAQNDLRELDAALSRAGSAELGCEIAYRREPTQAEGDAHADGADECFVAMGGWTGRRCRACGRWVWGGPTACDRCVGREEREDTGHA